jgi:hypothetical protein
MSKIIKKIENKIGSPGILDQIANNLSNSEMNSLLLELFRRKTNRLTPAKIFRQFRQNRFSIPSEIDPIEYKKCEIEWLINARESGYKAVQLSPMAPLGSCSAVAFVDQNNIVSALRGTEVVSDATNVLSLKITEEFKIRKNNPLIKYCTTHRHVRGQYFTNPAFSAHFGVFCMVSGGYDSGGYSFELDQLMDHITFYSNRLLTIFQKEDLFVIVDSRDKRGIFHTKLKNNIDSVKERIDCQFKALDEKNNYYETVRFKIFLKYHGASIDLVDGGFVNWTQRILSNKKHRLLVSGTGLELIYKIKSGMI